MRDKDYAATTPCNCSRMEIEHVHVAYINEHGLPSPVFMLPVPDAS